MSQDENIPSPGLGVRHRDSALQLQPRKKACAPDPLVHYGRHFGRTVHALCNVETLVSNGAEHLGLECELEESGKRESHIFRSLIQMVPGLQQRLLRSSREEIALIAKLIEKGVSSARSDDTKTLKSSILDWIAPPGQHLNPPLSKKIKTDRGFHHECTGALLCPAGLDWSNMNTRVKLRNEEYVVPGDQWPLFIYKNYSYDPDDPWNGAFQSELLVKAYKHIFTSPRSVHKKPKATSSGVARIHGMAQATPASIAYVSTQVRFALTSTTTFSKRDKVTNSEKFYNSVLSLFDDPDEEKEVAELLTWWNREIFPNPSSSTPLPTENSVLVRIKEKRTALKALQLTGSAAPERSL